jgi:hypothetical protein
LLRERSCLRGRDPFTGAVGKVMPADAAARAEEDGDDGT